MELELEDSEAMEPPLKQNRFATVDEDEIDQLLKDRVPLSTRHTTEKWLRVIEAYLKEKGTTVDFGTVEESVLASILQKMYVELRQRNDQPYGKSSLLGCRSDLHRHLSEIGQTMNIYSGSSFKRANTILDGELKRLKKHGYIKPVEPKQPLTTADMQKLNQYFTGNKDNPVILTEKVWFNVTYDFCMRACEAQALLRVQDLAECRDEQGRTYYQLSTSFKTKNYQGGIGEDRIEFQTAELKPTTKWSPSSFCCLN